MSEYTTDQLKRGEGLYAAEPTLCVSYDGGRTWNTMQALSQRPGGEPTDVLVVPAGGTWEDAV
jgi:hypothetical protein